MYRIEIDRQRLLGDSVVESHMLSCGHLPVYGVPGQESGSVAVCAAGPSLLDEIEMIRSLYRIGVPICAAKGTHDVLIAHGIIPKYAVFMDPQENQARFLRKLHPDVQYLMCTQTHPNVMRLLEGFNVLTFHGQCKKYALELETQRNRPASYIHASTTGLAAINLMRSMGYRPLHLFGFDCSYKGGVSHVYDKPAKETFEVSIGYVSASKRYFTTTLPLADQHNSLIWLFSQADCGARAYGDGAFQQSVRNMARLGAIPEDYIMLIQKPPEGISQFHQKELRLPPEASWGAGYKPPTHTEMTQ